MAVSNVVYRNTRKAVEKPITVNVINVTTVGFFGYEIQTVRIRPLEKFLFLGYDFRLL
jgi:hypothetical protein